MISSAIRESQGFYTIETMVYNITSGTNIFQVPMCKKCSSLLVIAENTCLECYVVQNVVEDLIKQLEIDEKQTPTTKIHFCAFARVGEYIASLAKNGIQQIDKNIFR
jgi:hypothetical protein